jgi:hypothetical protein
MPYSSRGMSVLLAPTTCANPPSSPDAAEDPASGCNQNQLPQTRMTRNNVRPSGSHNTINVMKAR